MLVGVNSAVAWQHHPVLTKELAVGKGGVGGNASIRPRVVKVEEVERVDVSGGELGRLN